MSHASPAHDAPLELLRETPRILLTLLQVAGVELSEQAAVEVVATELHEAVPTHRAADFVALVRDASGVALVVIVEVQRRTDARKRWTWPLYAAQLEAKHKARAVLVVLALESKRAAEWARAPTPPWPSTPFAPLVLGPDAIAEFLEQAATDSAVAAPEILVLGAMARLAATGRRRTLGPDLRGDLTANLARALAAIRAISSAERQAHLLALLQSVARQPAARAILEELLEEHSMNTLQRMKEEARREGKAEGRALGEAQGQALGEARGEARGQALGEARGKADALLRLLRRRGFEVSPEIESRVLRMADVGELDRWFDRAIDAASIEGVFEGG